MNEPESIWKQVLLDDEARKLIKQLKDRGFAVFHRDGIRTVSARHTFDKDMLLRAGFPAERIVRDELAIALARELVGSDAFPLHEVARGIVGIAYEASLTVLGERISPESAAYPLYLQRGGS